MHVYKELGSVTVVGFGLSLCVAGDKATVEYNDLSADYFEVMQTGRIAGLTGAIVLDKQQLAWLDDSRAWVKHQIENSQ